MELFTVDNVGETELLHQNTYENDSATLFKRNEVTGVDNEEINKNEIEYHEDISDLDFGDLPRNAIDISDIIKLPPPPPKTELQKKMDKFCKMIEKFIKARENNLEVSDNEYDDNYRRTDVEKELKNCEIGIEQKKCIENLSEKQRIKRGKEERSKSKGKNWFNLPATEVTDEVKNELEIVQMRSVLDPQHFYKKNDLKVLPKYFQIGKVLPSPLDYYNERDTRKTKRKTLVDELMEDAQFQRFNKRKYAEIMEEKKKSGYHKANKKMKKLKKNKS